ncbi:hybrid sensor histidine kinase/response regulator [Acanthopleuribacter pedis]|uniref:histidine kinase n=1 Tax=Acanthopleuribacter pedis TaxID=442870 RepID=A0A8J7Q3M1_9BACT|nr:ATP-binding protein [Acanthopleuribacter pedis]MBO1317457.1 response regulator [Acanthopleuribacter pedis]
MFTPAIPPCERRRLEALTELEILDTASEPCYDQLTGLAAEIAETPIALISLVDPTRQWFKAKVGLDASETTREISFCGHAINHAAPMVVPDTLEDPRFHDNPLVSGPPHIRFYMGFPLQTNTGYRLGTLCVIDRVPRNLTPKQTLQLSLIRDQIVRLFEARLLSKRYQEQLQESLNLAHEKRLFLASLSHEIRNPLNAIVGLTDLLLAPDHQEKDLDSIRYIRETCTTISRQLEDLLHHSRLDHGKVELEIRRFDLYELLRRIVATYQVPATKKGLSLSWSWDEELPHWFLGDAVRLEQVLTNLIGNALKFTKQGSVTLSVSGYECAEEGRRLKFQVTDTGEGIQPKRLDQLFKPYQQANPNTWRQHGGSGLGLCISKSLVELMGGRLTVESDIEVGSCFTIELHLTESQPPPARNQPPKAAAKPKKILLIEDHPINQKVTERLLRRKGHQTVVAATGREALTQFKNHHFDALLVDYHLPDCNGFTLVQTLRKMESESDLPPSPIAVLSGDKDIKNGHSWHEEKVHFFMAKPVTIEALETLLEHICSTNNDRETTHDL